jgi:4-amino-4-deoxy-L-arabinose transferase-like glycosyltransferase
VIARAAAALAAWLALAFGAALDGAARSNLHAALLVGLVTLAAAAPGLTVLPPTDRDESRFIQASRQMVETGDPIDIRFQDEARWKKPVGIYWAQAGAVAAVSALSGRDLSGAPWPYRLPSALGALAAGLGALWAFAPLLGRRAATLAGIMTGTALILAAEATIAKTDAALLGVVTLAMGAYLRLLDRARDDAGALAQAEARRLSLLFWGLIGLGALLKGPIVLIAPFGAALALCAAERGLRPLAAMGWRRGPALALLIAAPWYLAIAIRTDGAFFQEALINDLVAKLGEGKESHGAPPGTYLALLWAIFWPWAPLLLAATPWIWRARRRAEVLILLVWALPTWIAFELTPTKLPHYVMPAAPALAALIALWLMQEDEAERPAPRWRRIAPAALFAAVGGALALAAIFGPAAVQLGAGRPLDPGAAALAAGCGALALWPLACGTRALAAGAWRASVGPALAAALLLYTGVLQGALPALSFGFPSVRMAAAAAPWTACLGAPPATISYREPSLVFLQGQGTAMLSDEAAAARLAAGGGSVWVEDRRRAAFDAALSAHPEAGVRELASVFAFNPNRGETTTLRLLARAADPAIDACAAPKG